MAQTAQPNDANKHNKSHTCTTRPPIARIVCVQTKVRIFISWIIWYSAITICRRYGGSEYPHCILHVVRHLLSCCKWLNWNRSKRRQFSGGNTISNACQPKRVKSLLGQRTQSIGNTKWKGYILECGNVRIAQIIKLNARDKNSGTPWRNSSE